MQLYDFPFAPNPRKLRVYLAEKGIEVPLVGVNLVQGEQRTPEFLAKSPLGALPVLELDDGTCLTESLAIIEYFEELHPDPPMIGATPLERAQVRRLEQIATNSVLASLGRLFHTTKAPLPGAIANPAIADAARAALPRPLAVLNDEIGDHPFVAGTKPTIADCTLFATFKLAEMAEVDLMPGPNLVRWYAAFSQRPSAAA
ncbi:MAG: glutathione S-transferase family protein [Deltaproteobacteria bacterium]|nr:glutathione S-transferase family protein [Deltaproteobacteria bacterium]